MRLAARPIAGVPPHQSDPPTAPGVSGVGPTWGAQRGWVRGNERLGDRVNRLPVESARKEVTVPGLWSRDTPGKARPHAWPESWGPSNPHCPAASNMRDSGPQSATLRHPLADSKATATLSLSRPDTNVPITILTICGRRPGADTLGSPSPPHCGPRWSRALSPRGLRQYRGWVLRSGVLPSQGSREPLVGGETPEQDQQPHGSCSASAPGAREDLSPGFPGSHRRS